MKSIVDSKLLHKAIKKAINYNPVKTKAPIVNVSPEELKLGKIKVPLRSNSDWEFNEFEFDIDKWMRVMKFLDGLDQQPITCEFDSEKIRIFCIVDF